jgi:hypothetical protein
MKLVLKEIFKQPVDPVMVDIVKLTRLKRFDPPLREKIAFTKP